MNDKTVSRQFLTMSQQILVVDELRLLKDDIEAGKYGLTQLAEFLTTKLGFNVNPSHIKHVAIKGLGLNPKFKKSFKSGSSYKSKRKQEHEALVSLVEELGTKVEELVTRVTAAHARIDHLEELARASGVASHPPIPNKQNLKGGLNSR